MHSVFGDILQAGMADIPSVVGSALVASDGELVDAHTHGEHEDWAFVSAHLAIILNHLRLSFYTFHFGDLEWVFLPFEELELFAEQVGDNYFLLLACKSPLEWGTTVMALHAMAQSIRDEIA